jgi:DNA-binding response OmpR family regulator
MRILLAESDTPTRGFLAAALRSKGIEVVQAADTAQMLVRLHGWPFAAVVLDQALPGIHPLALLPGLRMAWPDTPVILLGPSGDGACQQALECGAHAFLPKPVLPDELLRSLGAVGSVPKIVSGGPQGSAPATSLRARNVPSPGCIPSEWTPPGARGARARWPARVEQTKT